MRLLVEPQGLVATAFLTARCRCSSPLLVPLSVGAGSSCQVDPKPRDIAKSNRAVTTQYVRCWRPSVVLAGAVNELMVPSPPSVAHRSWLVSVGHQGARRWCHDVEYVAGPTRRGGGSPSILHIRSHGVPVKARVALVSV